MYSVKKIFMVQIYKLELLKKLVKTLTFQY